MAAPSITRKPPIFILSGTPAWFVVQAAVPGEKIVAIIKYLSTEIGREYAFASIDGNAAFELSEYFNDNINPAISSVSESGAIAALNGGGSVYFSKAFSVTFNGDDVLTAQTSHYVVKGIIEDHVKSLIFYGSVYSSFLAWLDATKSFLTFRPDTIAIKYADQPERLYFGIYKTDLFTSLTVKRTIYFADGTSSAGTAATISSATPGGVYEIKTSYTAMVLSAITEDPDNPVISYNIQLFDGITPVSKLMTYLVEFANTSDLTTFMFLNPAGGYDTFCATGKTQTLHQSEKKITPLVPAYTHDQLSYRIDTVNVSTEYICNTGFVGQLTISWLKQMMDSRLAYKVATTSTGVRKLLPVLFVKNSLQIKHDSSELPFAQFAYIYNLPLINEQSA